jgi:hypothetical protein
MYTLFRLLPYSSLAFHPVGLQLSSDKLLVSGVKLITLYLKKGTQ